MANVKVNEKNKMQNTNHFVSPTNIIELLSYYERERDTLNFTDDEIKSIWFAFTFARDAHQGQNRLSGEPFVSHPLAISKILIDLGMDAETIIASLLHDVVEDTPITIEEIEEKFGNRISAMVDGVTTLKQYENPGSNDAESIKKLFLAIINDPRVIVVKLADRLHNLRTIAPLPREKQIKTAKETLEIYAPLAERLGIWSLKGELEDQSFKCLEPEIYQNILSDLEKSREEHRTILNKMIEMITKKMIQANFNPNDFQVSGRRKYIYSIYKKMLKPKYEGKGLDSIYDKLGIRIILKYCSGLLCNFGVNPCRMGAYPG